MKSETENILGKGFFERSYISRRVPSYSPYGSHIGILSDMSSGAVGIGQMEIFGRGINGSPLELSLRSFLAGDSHYRTEGNWYPYGFTKNVFTGGVVLESTVFFIGMDRLIVLVKIKSLCEQEQYIQLVVYGGESVGRSITEISNGTNKICIEYVNNTSNQPSREKFRKHLALKYPDVFVHTRTLNDYDGLNLASLNSYIGGEFFKKEEAVNKTGSGYLAWSEKLFLRPDEEINLFFPLAYSLGAEDEKEVSQVVENIYSQYKENPSDAFSERKEYWNNFFLKIPAPKTKIPVYHKLYYKSAFTLENLKWGLYRNSPYNPYQASFPSKGNYNGHWLWDSCFHALGYKEYDIKLAEDQIKLLLKFQDKTTGLIPNYIRWNGETVNDRSQVPVIGWVAWEIYKKSHNKEFLKEIYDGIVKFDMFWEKHRDKDKDGLCEYGNQDVSFNELNVRDAILIKWETGWDSSPRWDTGCKNKEPVDLNCFLLVQKRCLGFMAEKLERKEEANNWYEKARRLSKRINQKMYCEDDKTYYDIYYDTHEFCKVKTPAMFFPLWAGICTKKQADLVIKKYLLNPEHFWPLLPSVAYSEPTYVSDEYWRGPTWINLCYFVMLGLSLYGYKKECSLLKKKVLEICSKNKHPGEYYDSRTGHSLGAQQYGWTAAFLMEMLLNRETFLKGRDNG